MNKRGKREMHIRRQWQQLTGALGLSQERRQLITRAQGLEHQVALGAPLSVEQAAAALVASPCVDCHWADLLPSD